MPHLLFGAQKTFVILIIYIIQVKINEVFL